MRADWDVPIPMDDGIALRADVFRPDEDGRYPVIMTHGPYAKWLAFQDGFPQQWANLEAEHPDALAGSSGLHMNWETVDAEKWVPDGYVVIRVDSRGAGRSPGFLDIFSARESRDCYLCIEWAADQPWSTGKVGLLGVSYYAINQWQVAALQPPHLAAICPWEGGIGVPMRGHGVFVHTEAADRPPDVFGGVTTLLSGGTNPSYLLLPVIPG